MRRHIRRHTSLLFFLTACSSSLGSNWGVNSSAVVPWGKLRMACTLRCGEMGQRRGGDVIRCAVCSNAQQVIGHKPDTHADLLEVIPHSRPLACSQ